MKLLDYLIIASLSMVWIGYRLEGVLAMVAVLMVASWRFYDRKQAQKMSRSARAATVCRMPQVQLTPPTTASVIAVTLIKPLASAIHPLSI